MRLSRFGSLLGVWPRRLLALACLLLAGVSTAHADAPKKVTTSAPVDVVVASRDLSPGTTISGTDVRLTGWPAQLRPVTAVSTIKAAVGRRVVGAIGTGEPITSTRLIGADMAAGLAAGMVAVPVPLVDSSAVSLIGAGDYVDLLSPPADMTNNATVVVEGALVLAVVPGDSASSSANPQLTSPSTTRPNCELPE